MRANWIAYCAVAGVLFAAACTDDDGGEDGGGDSQTGGGDEVDQGVPSSAYCDPVAEWSSARAAAEREILALVNAQRAKGATCGNESFGPARPLEMHPALRCAARVHTLDMAENDFFDHTNPAGEAPWDRMENAGYQWSGAAENIAGGSSTAKGSMQQWMNSPGHCSNIMNPGYRHIGVGYVDGANLWTQVFGSQR